MEIFCELFEQKIEIEDCENCLDIELCKNEEILNKVSSQKNENTKKGTFAKNLQRCFSTKDQYIERAKKKHFRWKALGIADSPTVTFDQDVLIKIVTQHGLKELLADGLHALETKHFQKDGKVTETRTVIPWEVRRKYLEMAMKVKGMFAPDKFELSGKDGGSIDLTAIVMGVSKSNEKPNE